MEFAPKPITTKESANTTQHLEQGIKPITICMTDQETHFDNRSNIESEHDVYLADLITDSETVNFKDPFAGAESNLSAGPYTYIISELSETSKKSLGYLNCTGVVATGISLESGNNISFISHQEPSRILSKYPLEFRLDLQQRLDELKKQSVPGTIDIVIAGGNSLENKRSTEADYKNMINLIDTIIFDELDIKPVIATTPKESAGQDSLIYDTPKRNLYISRSANLDMSSSAHYSEETDSTSKK